MKTVLLSRTDKIGDVILTLPMAGMIKKHYPYYKVLFLARGYTTAIAERCIGIDEVYDWDQIKEGEEFLPHVDYFIHVFPNAEISKFAKSKNIPHRTGTSHRVHHWSTCNHLVNFTRKGSRLHESQLNMKLLRPLGINEVPDLSEMPQFVNWSYSGNSGYENLLTEKFNLVFHMKSMGSAKEWSLTNYLKLAQELPGNLFQLYITGTAEEGETIRKEISGIFELDYVTDVTGQFNLDGFIKFIERCDGLLACSTGPLHIASIAGIRSLGLYPANKPIHAGRWAPIGTKSQVFSESTASKSKLLDIDVNEVKKIISTWPLED